MKRENTTKTFLDIKEVLRNGNSTTNQRIKGEFIAKHVYCNVNSMVEFIINQSYEGANNAPFTFDDITNVYTYPQFDGNHIYFEGGNEDVKQQSIDKLKELQEDAEEYKFDELEEDIIALENLESEPQEVFEWYKVSDFLCEKLEALGHPVISDENIWGRCTTGQAILLDYAITQICAEMEILEGQRNSWA